ncbi:MAG: rimK [Schlesneria sp.]|nr:rimK [Schlesneria sp.]
MKIGILASEGSWYYRDLERAALARGHACTRLDFERLVARVGSAGETISATQLEHCGAQTTLPVTVLGGDGLASFDVILVRTMPPGTLEQVVYRMDALARIAAAGTRVVNSPKSLECAVDKYLTTARLRAVGLPVPETIVCEHEDDAMAAFEELGRDVVIKPLFGAEGRGIVRVSDPDLAHRTFRTLMRLNAVLYLQRYIDHEGFDVRVLVLHDRVVGGMRRRSPHDFRTNVSRSAIAELHEVTSIETDYALRAANVTGADIAGVDLLYDRQGRCYVIEVNAVPGWQAFAKTTGIDVAARLIEELQSGLMPEEPGG